LEPKQLNSNNYNFLKKEIAYQLESGRITESQANDILRSYVIKEQMSFIKILVVIGSILIGLGVLSFIASNWIFIGKTTKLLLIFLSYLFTQFLSYKMEKTSPKTSRSFNYLGVLIFGAGIFLIGQMFHFGGKFTNAFLLWGIGILPLALLLKDKVIFVFLQLTLFVYLNGQFLYENFPFILVILIPILYLTQKQIPSKLNLFITNLLSLNLFLYLLVDVVHVDDLLIVLLSFFIIGVLFYFIPFNYHKDLFQFQGMILFGITGIILTIKGIWTDFPFDYDTLITVLYIVFVVGYILLLLYLIKQEKIIALLFLGITILRYYVDTMYDFLPKSILFFSSGLLLLGFGYYFERVRRRGMIDNERKK